MKESKFVVVVELLPSEAIFVTSIKLLGLLHVPIVQSSDVYTRYQHQIFMLAHPANPDLALNLPHLEEKIIKLEVVIMEVEQNNGIALSPE